MKRRICLIGTQTGLTGMEGVGHRLTRERLVMAQQWAVENRFDGFSFVSGAGLLDEVEEVLLSEEPPLTKQSTASRRSWARSVAAEVGTRWGNRCDSPIEIVLLCGVQGYNELSAELEAIALVTRPLQGTAIVARPRRATVSSGASAI